jgi:hypothetical protein
MLAVMATPVSPDPISVLCEEFRHELAMFYAELKLTPPYHSLEKAIAQLGATLAALSPEERAALGTDAEARWAQYRKAFAESGLHLKHRGIIAGLVKAGHTKALPKEHEQFLVLFTSDQDNRASSAGPA